MSTLPPSKDPMGTAISEYHHTQKAKKLVVQSSYFDDDEMPVPHLFRTYEKMPELERKALDLAQGKTLDVGAGAGCHAIELQKRGLDVTALDISQLSCNVMKERGIKQVVCEDLFLLQPNERFDTILLLMNGTGIVGKVERLPLFFAKMQELLSDNGKIYIDSSDLKYLYEEEDGSYDLPDDSYYGEVDFRMKYKGIKGDFFDWLYLDFETLAVAASTAGFSCTKIAEGKHYDFLAELSIQKS